jgi:putative OPT family oligopeptide transporter
MRVSSEGYTASVPSGGELTVRAVALGAAITLVFTAANVYLGLRAGLTFASSIPAAVISMAVLRALDTGSILENNIVQTVASAAGTLSSIIFVLPALVMVGWWSGFPFWSSFAICAFGGILGVMFSIPLRRALVARSTLPYPEGVAAAEVLKVGTARGTGDAATRRSVQVLTVGAVAAAGYAALAAMRLAATEIAGFVRLGASATGASLGMSLALLGAGHLVGLSVGVAMLAGIAVAWGVATPILTAAMPWDGSAAEVAQTVWRTQVRLIGAGAIGVAAIWSLLRLWRNAFGKLSSAMHAAAGMADDRDGRTDRDISGALVWAIGALCLLPLAWLLVEFIGDGPLVSLRLPLLLGGLAFILIAGWFVATVSGYMAGLIGSSNSPLSGVGILAAIAASLLAVLALHRLGAEAGPALVAYTLLVVAIVFAVATISNDNLQDLKTGELVGATPWRQQVALIFGVLAGAVVIPPVLDLLNQAYGFAGGPTGRAIAGQPLPAPQATLIAALAQGVLGGELQWGLIAAGAALGVALVVLDESLGAARRLRLPPLGVAMGIYLPMATTMPIVLGAVLGWTYERRAARTADPAGAKRLGVLLASGFIVGESLFGVLLAGVIVGSGQEAPLALAGEGFHRAALGVGVVAFIVLIAGLYAWIARQARRASPSAP